MVNIEFNKTIEFKSSCFISCIGCSNLFVFFLEGNFSENKYRWNAQRPEEKIRLGKLTIPHPLTLPLMNRILFPMNYLMNQNFFYLWTFFDIMRQNVISHINHHTKMKLWLETSIRKKCTRQAISRGSTYSLHWKLYICMIHIFFSYLIITVLIS